MLIIILCALAATGLIAYAMSDNPHDFAKGDCLKCHLDPSGHPTAMRTSVSRMCDRCHRKIRRVSSHPVDRQPKLVRIPADLPLSRGKITCNTCHNIHGKRFASLGGKTYFLRRPVMGREFCLSCHMTLRSAGGHAELIAVAHRGSRYQVVDGSKPLDGMSVECIGCHDGSVGKAVAFRLGQGVWNHDKGVHPIGVSYRENRMKRGRLVPVSMLDKRLRLFDGRIGCGTCHDMYSKLPKNLVKSNAGSRLCKSCHKK